jgi:peptidoglycan/xylan/chitin deacetylase (PgdA/CDA1 family)
VNALSIAFHRVLSALDPSLPPDLLLYCLDHRDFREHLYAIRQQSQGPIKTIAGVQSWDRYSPVFLTFDDGNAGDYECAASDLERYGWRGHFFVTTDWIGKQGFMDESQIRELHKRGHVIGSHSRSHPARMSSLTTKELLEEWGESRARLSDIINDGVIVASVADGYYSDRVGRTAAASGIRVLFTSEPKTKVEAIDGCLVLGRYVIQRWMPASTSGAIAAGRVWPRWRQAVAWEAKKALKVVGGRYYLRVRQYLLEHLHR